MSLRSLQKVSILLLICLICSITPAMAIQTENNHLKEDYNQPYEQAITDVWSALDEGVNTELTNEQREYLETHEDRLLVKAEAVLYNLQDFLNYLIKEYGRYHPDKLKQETSPQRKLLGTRGNKDKYTTDAIDMKNYLSTNKKGPKIKDIQTINCNYDQLVKMTEENGPYKGLYNKSHVIVQIKDPRGYIRYMRLINITGDYICLKSGSQDINATRDKFETLYVWHADGGYSNPDHMFNILFSPTYESEYILDQIWNKQNSNLLAKEAVISTGTAVSAASLGVGGLSVVTAGAYRLCDSCTKKAAQEIEEGIPPINEIDENTPLIQENGLRNKCLGYCSNCFCSKCGKSLAILTFGVFTFIGSAITLYYINKLKLEYDDDHKNLNKYEPLLN